MRVLLVASSSELATEALRARRPTRGGDQGLSRQETGLGAALPSPAGPSRASPVRTGGSMARIVVALLLLALTAGAELRPAYAGEREGGVPELPPVEVHGRRPFLADAPDRTAATTVVLRTELEQAGVDLATVLDAHAGLRVTRLGGLSSFATVSIRGSTSDQVRVFLDGVPLGTADGGGVDLSTLPLGPVERVEVFRGAAPAGIGGSAIGGVVHLRTRESAERRLELAAGGGSFGSRHARAFYAEPLGAVLLSLGLDYQGTEGNFRFLNDNGTAFVSEDDRWVTRRNNRSDSVGALVKLRVALGRGMTLRLQDSLYWRQRGLPGIALYETRTAGLGELRNITSLTFEWEGSGPRDPRVTTQASFTFLRTELNDPLGEVGVGSQETDDRGYTGMLRSAVVWPVSEVATPAATFEYRYERFAPYDSLRAGERRGDSDRHRFLATGEVAIRWEQLRTTVVPSGGVELAASRTRGRADFGTVDLGRMDTFDAQGTFRLGVAVDAVRYTIVKANAGRAVRLPTLFELFGETGYVRGNPDLRAERSWFADLGVVHDGGWLPRPHMLQIELFGFFSQTDDLIQLVQTAQNVAVAENVAAARIAGLEFGVRGDFFRHLRIRGGFTWMHSEDTSDIAARSGKALPFRPQWQWYGRVEGYHDFGSAVPELALHVEIDGVSDNYLDPANLVDARSRLFLGVGLSAWFLDRRLRLEVTARNLTGSQTVDLAGFPLPGRSFFASATARIW